MIDDFLGKLLRSSEPQDLPDANLLHSSGYATEWHVNPLLLEPNHARLAISST